MVCSRGPFKRSFTALVCRWGAVRTRSESWKQGALGMKNLRLAVLVALQLTLCLCVAGLFGEPLAAQTTYGSIAGTVSDTSGAAIADAQVNLTNLATAE